MGSLRSTGRVCTSSHTARTKLENRCWLRAGHPIARAECVLADPCVNPAQLHVDDIGRLGLIPGTVGLIAVLTYTAAQTPATFNPQDWPTFGWLRVRAWGGGGSGGGAAATFIAQGSAGGGGAGGSYAESILHHTQIGGPVTILVGAGG